MNRPSANMAALLRRILCLPPADQAIIEQVVGELEDRAGERPEPISRPMLTVIAGKKTAQLIVAVLGSGVW